MTFKLKARLKKLEKTQATQRDGRVVLRFGMLKKLPRDYRGERHVATVGGLGWYPEHPNLYAFEERPGPDPVGESSSDEMAGECGKVITVYYVRPNPESAVEVP